MVKCADNYIISDQMGTDEDYKGVGLPEPKVKIFVLIVSGDEHCTGIWILYLISVYLHTVFVFLFVSQTEENSIEEEDKECTGEEGKEDEEQNSQRRSKTAWRCNQENREILIDEPGELVSEFQDSQPSLLQCVLVYTPSLRKSQFVLIH